MISPLALSLCHVFYSLPLSLSCLFSFFFQLKFMCVFICTYIYVCRSEVDFTCLSWLPSTLFFKTEFLSEVGPHWLPVLCGQWALESVSLLFLSCKWPHLTFLHGYWGSLCLCRRHIIGDPYPQPTLLSLRYWWRFLSRPIPQPFIPKETQRSTLIIN